MQIIEIKYNKDFDKLEAGDFLASAERFYLILRKVKLKSEVRFYYFDFTYKIFLSFILENRGCPAPIWKIYKF